MKKLYKNLKHIVKILENKYPEFLYYKDDIYEITNLYLGDSNNNYINDNKDSYMSEEESINLVRMFLSIFDCGYEDKFDEADKLLLTKEEIETLLQNNNINDITKRRLQTTLKSEGCSCVNVKTGQALISILKNNTIKDTFLLLHEFVHSLSQLNGNLTEVKPILSELMLSYYLKINGYSEIEINKYWNERIELLAPCGYFIDLCFTLKIIDIFRENGFITKEILNMDDEQFNSLVKRYEDNASMYSFVKNLDSIDFKHLIGFYKALKIYAAVDEDKLYSVFAELNGVGLWLDEIEFNNYIDMVIKDEAKSRTRIKE